MSLSKTIYLFRHGRTDWNDLGRLQGNTNTSLNSIGKEQAKQLQQFFDSHSIGQLYSSDRLRAIQTMEIATEKLNLPIVTSEHLREVSLGPLEGLTEKESISQFGIDSWQKWISLNKQDTEFAFPNAESYTTSNRRLHNFIIDLTIRSDFQTTAICSHGLLIKRFIHSLQNETSSFLVPNCKIFVLSVFPQEEKIVLISH